MAAPSGIPPKPGPTVPPPLIVSRCTEMESGGCMIDAILTNTFLPRISQEILVRLGEGRPVAKVGVTAPGEDFEYAFG